VNPEKNESEPIFLVRNKTKKQKKKKPRLAAGEAVEKGEAEQRKLKVYLGILHCCLMHPRVGVR